MSPSIAIHPLSDQLDMYGQPDSSTAYSLSGHVTVSISSPRWLFDHRRTSRLLLHSLCLTFEGQSEAFTPDSGYSGTRLCTVSQELVNCPMELSNEGHEDFDDPVAWNIIFNLPIPGWLPPTTTIGQENVGVRYALFATAKYTPIDDEVSSIWGIPLLCTPFRSRLRNLEVKHKIQVRRYITHPSANACAPSPANYLVSAKGSSTPDGIPADILSKIQVLASVPEYVDIEDNCTSITLRLRTKDMNQEDCKRIQVTDVSVDLLQREKFRRRPATAYTTRYPLPPRDMQPPQMPLRDPHSISSVDEIGIFLPSALLETSSRAFSLLHQDESGVHKLADNNYVFWNDSANESTQTWYTMEVTTPFVRRPGIPMDDTIEWAGSYKLRPSVSTPLYTVHHEVSVAITCTYDAPGQSEPLKERLNFFIPIVFAKVAPQLHAQSTAATPPSSSPSLPLPTPYAPSLPPYSQLYDPNGDRKIDYSDPLPLYTLRPSSSTSLSPSEEETCPLLYDHQSKKTA
ncbi:hypothetical protein BDQ17DRAFT_1270182 [Cyathus striatus]|nr:hypothetical protein BDQ17DRAFT_1270182 [Cyathus striatus]